MDFSKGTCKWEIYQMSINHCEWCIFSGSTGNEFVIWDLNVVLFKQCVYIRRHEWRSKVYDASY